MRALRRCVQFVAIGAVSAGTQAAVFQVTATAQAGAQSQWSGSSEANPAPLQNSYSSAVAGGTGSSNAAGVGPASGSSSGSGYASAGLLRAGAQGSAAATFTASSQWAWGSGATGSSEVIAQLQDSFIVHAQGIPSGTRGSLTFSFVVNGGLGTQGVIHGSPSSESKAQWLSNLSVQSTLNGGSFGSASWYGGEYRDDADWRVAPYYSDLSVDGHPSLGVHQFTLPIVFDQAVNLSMSVDVAAMASAGSSCSWAPQGLGCTTNNTTATADFAHTVFWGGIASLSDANGQAVTQYTALSAGSGFDYAAAAVPEPATGLLMALGLAGLLGRRRDLRAA